MSRKRIKRHHPKFFDSERLNYLQELKEEFLISKSRDCRHQTIANLANFAYNPENHQHLINLSMHRTFLEQIGSSDDFISVASIKGLCNLAPNPSVAMFILENESIERILICIHCKKHLINFIINAMLLLTTIKRMNIPLDKQLKSKIDEITINISKEVNDIRVKNYCQIITQNCQ